MYRSALVALKPGSSNDVACRYAVALAQRAPLRLVGMVVIDAARVAPAEAVPLGGGAYKAMKDEARLERAREAARDTLQGFSDRCRAAGVVGEGRVSEGELAAVFATAAQRTDMLVLGHRAGQDIDDVASVASALHAILRHCPRPAIVVPAFSGPTQHVLVAYDGSLQAARAVQAFVTSGLPTGRLVHILSIQEDPAAAESLASVAGEFLQGHGITVETLPEVSRGPLAHQILEAVRRTQADLLVMGAYGQSSLREFVFGSTTRVILNAIEIPVFLDS